MKTYFDLLTFIKQHKENWLQLLKQDPYNLSIVQCPFKNKENELLYPELYMLSYNMYLSDFSNPIVKACRGCIVSIENPNEPVMICTPFHKFFNYGETNCDEIDWKSAVILEKVDGSLLKLFNYKNTWIWVTNNGWNIETKIKENLPCKYIEKDTDGLETFNDLKNYALNNILKTKALREEFDSLDKENTYMFELISPKNRIICEYQKTDLYFLGVRNKKTYEETLAKNYKKSTVLSLFKQPKVFNLNTINDVLQLCDSYKTTENEGVVVCDKNFNRFKIKCAHYVSIKYAKHCISLSNQRLLETYINEDLDDLIKVFPEMLQKINTVKNTYSQFYKKALSYKELGNEKLKQYMKQYDFKIAKKQYVDWIFKTYGQEKTFEVIFLLMAEKDEKYLASAVNKIKYIKMLEWIQK